MFRYGDITPQTAGGKGFMVVYMLASTVLVAGILGQFIDLYVCDIVGEGIIEQIMYLNERGIEDYVEAL